MECIIVTLIEKNECKLNYISKAIWILSNKAGENLWDLSSLLLEFSF